MLALAAVAIYAGALLVAAASDLVRYQIPNQVGLALLGAFVLFATALPLATTLLHVSAGLAVILLTALCFALGAMGGGDAKLLGAAALWTGWRFLLPFLLVAAVAGAVLALTLLAVRRFAPEPRAGRWYSRLLSKGEGVPFGIAIAFAGLVLLPQLAAPAWP